jgi:diacylglycerol O-acyltransferase / wax synthase
MGDRMTALDAAFYHLERAGQLLHVGGIYTVAEPLDYGRTLADLAAKLHLIPRYTQRVVPVPLNLGHPTWEPARGFDLRLHVVRHVLRPPGDDEQLRNLASRLFAEPLDRSRPLWELHQIDGYGGERSVIFAKVHHCMIDGVSGVQLLNVMFDPSPKPAAVPPPEGVLEAPPLPSSSTRLIRGARHTVMGGLRTAGGLVNLLRQPRRAVAELGVATESMMEIGRLLFAAKPSTPFNGHVGVLRQLAWTSFSLNEVKAIKNRLGGTVNDVILATITAALRAYLLGHGHRPDRMELRAMVPVNVRTPNEHLKLGNRVSMMMAPLPIGILDPVERLHQVRTAMVLLKESGQAGRMNHMIEMIDVLPPTLQRVVAQLQMAAAPINTICTNVPGPPVSIYVQGKRLETLVPLVPLAQGVGLAFAILSYADTLTIGITADAALVPDCEQFGDLLQSGLEELRLAAGVEHPEPRSVRSERQRRIQAVPSQVA